MQRRYGEGLASTTNTKAIPLARHEDTALFGRDITSDDCFKCAVINEEVNCVNRGYVPRDKKNSAAIVIRLFVKQADTKQDIEILSLHLKINHKGYFELFSKDESYVIDDYFHLSDVLKAINYALRFLGIRRGGIVTKRSPIFLLRNLPIHYFIADSACLNKSSCQNQHFLGLCKNKNNKTKNRKQRTKIKTKKYKK